MAVDLNQFLNPDGDAAMRAALPQRITNMRGSAILAIADEVRALLRSGQEVANFTVGDFAPSEFRIPESLRDGIVTSMKAGETNYPPAVGLPELHQAIADQAERDLGLRVDKEAVVVGSGARPLIYATWRLFVEPGDKTVSFVPAWNVGYYSALTQSDHHFIPTSPETNFHPTADQFREAVRGASLVVLNSPLNPTGTVISPDILRDIAQALVDENRGRKGRPLMMLFDQVYWTMVSEGAEHKSPVALVPECAPYVIHVDAISKSFAATGLRLGWAIVPPYLRSKMGMIIGHTGAWAPRPVQAATARFLDEPSAVTRYHQALNDGVFGRLNRLYEGIQRLKGKGLQIDAIRPQGGLYLSLRIDLVGRGFTTNEEIRKVLLQQARIAVVPFQAFDLPDDTGWFRMSVGAVSPQQIDEAIVRLGALLEEVA